MVTTGVSNANHQIAPTFHTNRIRAYQVLCYSFKYIPYCR